MSRRFAPTLICLGLIAGCNSSSSTPNVIIPENPAPLPAMADGGQLPSEAGDADEPQDYDLDFTLSKIGEEGEIALADLEGKVVIVDIWATWCPPCRDEIPHFIALQDKYGEQGLQVIGINFAEKAESDEAKKQLVIDYMKEHEMNYPCLFAEKNFSEKIPNFGGFPTTIFIGRDGAVKRTVLGSQSASVLEGYVTALLDEGQDAGDSDESQDSSGEGA